MAQDAASTKTMMDTYRPALAEFFAMTLFVWCGCGTAVSVQALSRFSTLTADVSLLLTISVAFGLAISVLVYTIAPISGGHINPAVTFAFVVSGKMPIVDGLRYVIAQCLGAILGAALVWGNTASDLLSTDAANAPFNVGMNSVEKMLPTGSAFLGESIGTFLLVFTVLMTAVHPKSIAQNIAPIAIGWSVLLAHLILIPLTGCGINPGRSLGPMLIVLMAGDTAGLRGWWVFYTAPFLGSLVAVVVCKYIFQALDDVEDAEAEGKIFEKESRAAQAAGAAPTPASTPREEAETAL